MKTTTPDLPERGHSIRTDKSPLTRALCQAAGLPDVEALMVALSHPMTEGDEAALVKRTGGHPAHKARLTHLRKLAQQGAEETQKSFRDDLAKSAGAVAHHKMIALGKDGPGSRGGHPWWNPHRNSGQGDWDYGPRPLAHHDINEPDHPDHGTRLARVATIEKNAYDLSCETSLPLLPWDRPKRTRKEKLYLAHEMPVDQVHLDRLRDAWTAATAEHHTGGRDWYPRVYELCQEWSEDTSKPDYEGRPLSADEIAMIIAVASPRMPWEANINIAHNVIFGTSLAERNSDGEKMKANHVAQIMNKISIIKAGLYPSLTAMLSTENGVPQDLDYNGLMKLTPKTYSFWRNMTNRDNEEAATADRHMFSIIGFNVADREDEVYHYAVRAIREVAAEKGVDPRVLQAVTWVWYEDRIAGKVKAKMTQAIKERESDNDVYGTHLRAARGHKAIKNDPKTMAFVAMQHRKHEEEMAKLARAQERAAKSTATGGNVHTKNLLTLDTARSQVEKRREVLARHNHMIAMAHAHAAVRKSFRVWLTGSFKKAR
jgi:hypothetical protein